MSRQRSEQHAEHADLARQLEALERAEHEDLRGTLASPLVVPGPAEEDLRRRLLSGTRPAAPARIPWGWLAATVAAGLALLLWLQRADRPLDSGPILGSGLALVHPRGEVDSFAPFRWEHAGGVGLRAPGAGWYRVVVLPAGKETTPTDSGALRTTSWSPDPEVIAGWGAEIRYRVEVYGGAGEGDLVDSVGAWAKLSSR